MNDAVRDSQRLTPVKYGALTIQAAANKGYYVYQASTEETRGAYLPVLFAGDLEQCLEWVRSRIRD